MTELAYIERTSDYATTNTSKGDLTAVIPSLSVTVVGTGAAVVVEFHCPAMSNPAALPTSWFVVSTTSPTDKYAEQFRNWTASTGGVGGSMRLRKVLANGTSYTFKVGLSGASSTTTAKAVDAAVSPAAMFLRVTD